MQQNKKGIYNIIFGLIGQFTMILLGIIVPRLVLLQYGSEVNGLLNSVNQIFMYVSLLEAGVGTASIQALYKPIAENNKGQINHILSATNRYYKKTGCIYAIVVCLVAVVYPFVIKNELSSVTIFWVFLFTGMGGAINFWFQGKFRLYLEADGKNYILVSINTCVYVLQSITKVILILNEFSVVAVQFSYFLLNLFSMAIILCYIRKKYSWLDVNTEPDFQAIAQKNSVLVHQIAGMIFNNTDVLLLSFFCGLKVVSIYSMYNLIISYVMNLINQVSSGFKFKMGQTYAVDKTAYIKLHNMFEIANMIIVFSCFTLVYLLILPFIRLYTAGVTDIDYIDSKLPFLFVVVQLLSNGRTSSTNLINYAGHFKKTQMRAVLESVINITVSIICIRKWGIYGVLFGTIAALLYRANDMILYSHKYILRDSPMVTYRRWIISFILFVACISFFGRISVPLDSYIKIFGYGTFYMIGILSVYILVHAIFERKVYGDYWKYFKRLFHE